jgi:hypothetical protein
VVNESRLTFHRNISSPYLVCNTGSKIIAWSGRRSVYFSPEDGCGTLLRNVGWLKTHYKALYRSALQSCYVTDLQFKHRYKYQLKWNRCNMWDSRRKTMKGKAASVLKYEVRQKPYGEVCVTHFLAFLWSNLMGEVSVTFRPFVSRSRPSVKWVGRWANGRAGPGPSCHFRLLGRTNHSLVGTVCQSVPK